MSNKKSDLLAAFTEVARPTHEPRPPRQEEARPSGRARTASPRKNLIYRTSRANWERIKHLAISDDVSVQALFHTALSREFERRGLPALAD